MIFEPEFVILTMLVFSLTAAAWVYTHGVSFSLADLTTIQNKPNQSIRRTSAGPMLLTATNPASTPVIEKTEPQTSCLVAGSVPLDHNTQLNRVSHILQTAIALADKAERLHNAAHEQLDSAHYALQNLLDELSTVMPIASPAKPPRDVSAAPAHTPRRSAYVTAIAA